MPKLPSANNIRPVRLQPRGAAPLTSAGLRAYAAPGRAVAGIGQALGAAARSAGQGSGVSASDEARERARQYDDWKTDRLYNPRTGYLTTARGVNAIDGWDGIRGELQAQREKYGKGLSEEARKIYDARTHGGYNSAIGATGRHAASEHNVARAGQAASNVSRARDDASRAASGEALRANLKQGIAAIVGENDEKGLTAEQTQADVRGFVGKTVAGSISEALEKGNIEFAEEALKAHKKGMDDSSIDKSEQMIAIAKERREVKNLSDEVIRKSIPSGRDVNYNYFKNNLGPRDTKGAIKRSVPWKYLDEQGIRLSRHYTNAELTGSKAHRGRNVYFTPDALRGLDKLTTSWGGKLPIFSTHRDFGSARHPTGTAFDIDTSGMSLEEIKRLLTLAREAGATGAGVYYKRGPDKPSFIHIDWFPLSGKQGYAETWGTDQKSASAPQWLRNIWARPKGSVLSGGEVGSTGGFNVDVALSEVDAAEGAGKIGPKAAAGVRAEIRRRYGDQERARKEKRRKAFDLALSQIEEGKAPAELPAALVRDLGEDYEKVVDYYNSTVLGSKASTNPLVYETLTDMAADEPDKFAKVNLQRYYGALSPSDRKHFIKLQANQRGGGKGQKALQVDINRTMRIAQPVLDMLGAEKPSRRTGERDKRRWSLARGVVLGWEMAFLEEKGRLPTQPEIRTFAQSTFANRIDGDDFFNADRDSIPEADSKRIASDLLEEGVDVMKMPSKERWQLILERYVLEQALKWQGLLDDE